MKSIYRESKGDGHDQEQHIPITVNNIAKHLSDCTLACFHDSCCSCAEYLGQRWFIYCAYSTINVASHEQMEAATNPLMNAWFDSSGQEIGDKCTWNFGDVNLDNNQANVQWNSEI